MQSLNTLAIPVNQPRFHREVEAAPEASGHCNVQDAGQNQLASAFENAAIGMTLVGPDLRRLRVNKAFCQMLGYTESELMSLTLGNITHPDDLAEDMHQHQLCLSNCKDTYQREKRYLHRDGRIAWGHLTCTLVRDAQGRPLHFISQIQDITQRRLAEQALYRSEERFRSLTMLSSDWYWEQDEQFRFTTFSGTEHAGPWRPDEKAAVGLRRWELNGVSPLHMTWEQHRAVLESHQPFIDFQYICVAADGSPRYRACNGEPVFDEDGHFRGYRGTVRDITQGMLAQREILRLNAELEARVKQRTAQLEAANKELEAFSYSIAHDLRAPLGSIDGFSQMLEQTMGQELTGRCGHYLRRIRMGVKQMGELTDGLLTLAHVSRASLRSEPVDLAELARTAISFWRERSPERAADIEIAAALPVCGDPRLLSQVIGNLVGNAWKFTAKKAHARIEVGVMPGPQGEPVYFVRDNGAGFDMAHASRMFEAFQRMHSAAEFEGTGIGLATVQRIVARHGGRIRAESAPGQGASFYFTLGQGAE